jgi:RNA polymerase-binding protein DksA
MHSKEFIEKMKEQLLEEKEKLDEELKETLEHTEMGEDEDSTEAEAETDEVNHDIIAQLKDDLKKIDAALQRIEKNNYGICSVGGEEISEARLQVIPWAETCVDHEGEK